MTSKRERERPPARVAYPVQRRPKRGGQAGSASSGAPARAVRSARGLLAALRAEPGMPLAVACGFLVGVALAVLLFGR